VQAFLTIGAHILAIIARYFAIGAHILAIIAQYFAIGAHFFRALRHRELKND